MLGEEEQDEKKRQQRARRKKVEEALMKGDYLQSIDGYVSVPGIEGCFKPDESDGNGKEGSS